ncbi:MAG: 3-methylornithyl-N6-L-lysine dehydrogenase PylD, partial [Coriobacteriales bacterium]|nr:3-methylornithyl-N6-L-lysine dehydrogenase PylD [Coriobacteriales bacterium]
MCRLLPEHIERINLRLPKLEAHYRSITGMSLLEIAHFAAETYYLPLWVRKRIRVACVPITADEGILSGFSETVALILREFADVDAFVTETADVTGFNEAVHRDADLVYLADDTTCICRNLRTGVMSDNGFATGRGFAALLYLSSCALHQEVLILGSGKVGAAAYHFLAERNVLLKWFDLKENNLYSLDSEHFSKAWEQKAWDSIIDATDAPAFIGAEQVKEGAVIAAPGIPFGLTEAAESKAR